MKDKTSVNEISRDSRAIESPLGRVSRTPSLHISGSGSRRRKHKKISRSRFTLEINFESTRGHVYPLMSIFTCYDDCHVRKKLQYQNENLLAKRVTYIYIYLWYQESGLNYVGQGMITGRQVFLYYLSRKRLDWILKQCLVGEVGEWLLNQ